MEAQKVIGYCRVSRDEQGRSGLGLLAQKDSIQSFADREGLEVICWVEEVHSGRDDERPNLAAAMRMAKREGAVVCVSRVCRLSRRVSFVASLLEQGVPFYVADLGRQVDSFMVHLCAAFAEEEAKKISRRTTEALAQAKARGVQLGNPRLEEVRHLGWEGMKRNADDFALKVEPMVMALFSDGKGWTEIAEHLNSVGLRTRRGGPWYPNSVRRVVKRISNLR